MFCNTILDQPECYGNDIRVAFSNSNQFSYPSTGYGIITGRVEVCSNGTYIDVCDDGELDFNVANLICTYIGYTSKSSFVSMLE